MALVSLVVSFLLVFALSRVAIAEAKSHAGSPMLAIIVLDVFVVLSCGSCWSAASTDEYPGLCGVDSLHQVCLHYGLPISREEVHAACASGKNETSMLELMDAAESFGLSALGLELSFEDFIAIPSPAIARVKDNHFLAVCGYDASLDQVRVLNYPAPHGQIRREEFERMWGGKLLVLSVDAREAGEAPLPPTPCIRFAETHWDFGTITREFRVTHGFHFTNTGRANLVIGELVSSCGCTAAVSSATEVVPGATGAVWVTFDPRGYRGYQHFGVRVPTNDPGLPALELTFSARVRTEVSYGPKIIRLGNVPRGSTVRREFYLVDTSSATSELDIVEIESEDPAISVGWEKIEYSSISDNVTRFRVIIDLATAGKECGRFESWVWVYTSRGTDPLVRVPVRGNVVPLVSVRPSVLFFGVVEAGESVVREVLLSHADGDRFQITSVLHDVAGLRVQCSETDGAAHVLVAEYSVGNTRRGPVSDSVRVHTSLPDNPVIEVPVSLFIEQNTLGRSSRL